MSEEFQLDVCWHSTFSRPVGYSMVSRTMALMLEQLGVEVSYRYLYGPGTVFPVAEDEVLDDERLNVFKRRVPGRNTPHLVYGQADAFSYVKRGTFHPRYRIGFSMLETTGLPADWVRQFNSVDEVWTPTEFNVWTFRRCGVTSPICIMPLGVDVEHFNPGKQGYPHGDRFTFLSIFEWGERKAPEILLKAFNSAFRREEPVVLICKFDNWDGDVDIVKQMDAMDLDPGGGEIVFIENQYIEYEQLPALYRSADCFVFPTRGEGWGMPILEAMACGLPVIATNWSAQQTFLTDANSYPVQVSRLIDAKAKCPYYEGFKWAETDTGHLKRLLRHVYENPGERRAKGEQGARDVREKWSLQLCGERIRGRLEEIARERSSKRKPAFSNRPQSGPSARKIGLDVSRLAGMGDTPEGRLGRELLEGLAALDEKANPFDYLLLPGYGSFVEDRYLEDYSFDGVSDRRFTVYRGPLPAFGGEDHYVPNLDLVCGMEYVETGPVPLRQVVVVLEEPGRSAGEDNMRQAARSDCRFMVFSDDQRDDLERRYGIKPARVFVASGGDPAGLGPSVVAVFAGLLGAGPGGDVPESGGP